MSTNRNVLFPCDLWTRPAHIRLMAAFPRHVEWFLFVCTLGREARTGRLETGGQPLSVDDLTVLPRNAIAPQWVDACLENGVLVDDSGCLAVAGWEDFHKPPPSKSKEAERERWHKRQAEKSKDSAETPQALRTPPQQTPHTEPNRTEPNHYHNRAERSPEVEVGIRGRIVQAAQQLEPGGPSQILLQKLNEFAQMQPPDGVDASEFRQTQVQKFNEAVKEIANSPPDQRSKIRCRPSVALKIARQKLADWAQKRKQGPEEYPGVRIVN